MDRPHVDYDRLAATYHSRYAGVSKLDGIATALGELAARYPGGRLLEVGCGTGRFLEALRATDASVYGVDASQGMLAQGALRLGSEGLAVARANDLPFAPGTFDMICCVNAIHHFDDPNRFLADAAAMLTPNGALTIVGMDPRTIRRRYFYEYFEGSLDIDMHRYPSFGQLVDWLASAGLDDISLRIVESPEMGFRGREILADPFLDKKSNSLLALLSDEVYEAGMRRIEAAAEEGKEFWSELPFGMITGFRSAIAGATGTT